MGKDESVSHESADLNQEPLELPLGGVCTMYGVVFFLICVAWVDFLICLIPGAHGTQSDKL